MKRLGIVVLILLAIVAALALRYATQRAEHQRLREQEIGRAPAPAPKRVTAAAPTTPPLTHCVSGVVLDHGAPVAGMQVSVSDAPYAVSGDCPCPRPTNACQCREGLALLPALPRAGLVEAVKGALTDAAGRFELCALEGTGARLLWGEHLDGRLAVPEEPAVRPGTFVELQVLTFLPAHGVVLADQTPVPGATVLAFSEPPFLVRTITTDARGRFETTLPLGWSDFVVSAQGFAAQRVDQRFDPQRALVLELRSSVELTVRAVFEGRPLAGVEVVVEPEAPQLTDAQGLVHFSLRAGGRPTVFASKGELLGSASVNLLQGTRRVDLTLEKGARLSGVVLDEQGQPHQAKVRGLGLRGKALLTDPAGHFTSELIPESAQVHPVAFAEDCDDSDSQTVQVRGAPPLTLKLACGQTANGVVLDADGKPLEGVLVRLHGSEHQENVHTDAAGAFRFHQPPATYRLKVNHERYRAYEQPLQLPAKDVTVVLDAGGSISGRVVDGKGAPRAGVRVTVVPAVLDALLKEVEGGNSSTDTDADGRFQLSGLLAGRLVVSATGESLGTAVSEVVVLQPAEHREGLVLTLDEKVDLTGLVLDEERRPIPGARLTWEPGDERSALVGVLMDAVRGRVDQVMRFMPSAFSTDLDGRFQLRGLPVSKVKLTVSASGFASQEKSAARGEQVDFVLVKDGARVRGRVVDEAGRALTQFTVDGATFTPDDGRFEVAGSGQSATLLVAAPGFARLRVKVKLDAPEKDLGDLVLKQGRALRVEVRSEHQPLAGVRVIATQKDAEGASCVTKADGTCALEPLLDLETLVKTYKTGFMPASATVPAERLEQPLTVELAPAKGRLGGQVFAAPGQPAAARTVIVSGAITRSALTAPDGTFTVEGLPEGRYCVSLEGGQGDLDWAVHAQASERPSPLSLGPVTGGAAITGSRTLPGQLSLVQGSGPPLPLTRLLLRSACRFAEELPGPGPTITLTTLGDFRVEGLPPGRWSAYFVSLPALEDPGEVPPVVLDLAPGDVKQF